MTRYLVMQRSGSISHSFTTEKRRTVGNRICSEQENSQHKMESEVLGTVTHRSIVVSELSVRCTVADLVTSVPALVPMYNQQPSNNHFGGLNCNTSR